MKNFAVQLAKKAGKEIAKTFHHHKVVKVKSKTQIVTASDLIADKLITQAIRKKYPDHNIISEESKHKKTPSGYTWVIDPIDGTTNFSIGSHMFAVSIALFKDTEPVLGVVYAPLMDELYVGEKGKGATLNGKKIKVSKTKSLGESMITYCHGAGMRNIKRCLRVNDILKIKSLDSRQFGSASVECGFVASGRVESFVSPGAHSWDVGAGAVIVAEAGGMATDMQGKPWNLKSKDFVVSNGVIHKKLISLIKHI